jgi:hypothetical protein
MLHSSLRRKMNARAGADLFVPEAVCRPVQLHNVEALRRSGTRGLSAHHNAISGLQRKFRHPDLYKLREVVHLELPAFVIGLQYDKRMRVDEVKFRNNTFDRHLPVAVINTRDRVMHRKSKNQG